MSIIYAIPTYKRYDIIQSKTLSLLNSYDIPKKDIFIFVADKKEFKLYKEVLGDDYKIVVGVLYISKQRNFINNFFKEGQQIVLIDDDIDEISELSKTKLKRLPNLKKFVNDAFAECKDNNAYLWGIYPVNNHYFMRKTITKDLRFIAGGFYGIINRKSKDLKLWVEEKEDILKTLQYFVKDGIVIRYNFIGMKTKNYATGGISANIDRVKSSKSAVEKINEKYPTLTRIEKPTKTNPHFEIKLMKNKI